MLLIIDNQGGFAAEVAPYAEDLKVIFVRSHKQISPDMAILKSDDVIIVPHKNMAADLKSRGFTNRIVTLNYKNYSLQELYIAATGHPRYGAYLDNPFELATKSGDKKREPKVQMHKQEQVPESEQIEAKPGKQEEATAKENKSPIEQGFKVVERIVPHKTERRADGRIAQGKIRVERKGHDGFIKEKINLETGEVEVIEMQAPVDEIGRYGTKGAPEDFIPPAPEVKPSPAPKVVEVEGATEKNAAANIDSKSEVESSTAQNVDMVDHTEKDQKKQASANAKSDKTQERMPENAKPELKQKQPERSRDERKERKPERLEKQERKQGNRNEKRNERHERKNDRGRNNQERKQGNRNEQRNNRLERKQEGPTPKKLAAKVVEKSSPEKLAQKTESIEDKPILKEKSEVPSFVDATDTPNFVDESVPKSIDSPEDVPNFVTETKDSGTPNFISGEAVSTFVNAQESQPPNFIDGAPTAPVFKEDNGPGTADAPVETPSMSQLFDLEFE